MKYEPVRRSRSEDQFGELKNHFNPKGDFRLSLTGLPNKVCPRLRDSACWRSGEITQPRTSLIREPCKDHRPSWDCISQSE